MLVTCDAIPRAQSHAAVSREAHHREERFLHLDILRKSSQSLREIRVLIQILTTYPLLQSCRSVAAAEAIVVRASEDPGDNVLPRGHIFMQLDSDPTILAMSSWP